ncbi:hypothetical protein NX059_000255 [Plenodomus lindquistii]|nr:hypothetical protein NX059_000255 [Plenodomus lindquistii]
MDAAEGRLYSELWVRWQASDRRTSVRALSRAFLHKNESVLLYCATHSLLPVLTAYPSLIVLSFSTFTLLRRVLAFKTLFHIASSSFDHIRSTTQIPNCPQHQSRLALNMRSYILIAFLATVTFVSAIPITPAAPRWQRRAEQFRLQGLREFEIAERLMTPTSASPSEPQPFLSRLNRDLHVYLQTLHTDDEPDLSGDVAPGSADVPQMLPIVPASEELTFFERLCAVFHHSESGFGYEGKESEMRRPIGSVYWKQFGGFRR